MFIRINWQYEPKSILEKGKLWPILLKTLIEKIKEFIETGKDAEHIQFYITRNTDGSTNHEGYSIKVSEHDPSNKPRIPSDTQPLVGKSNGQE